MKIEGLVKDKMFHDEENGFHILKVKVDKKVISVKGYSPISVKVNDYVSTSDTVINIIKPTKIESIQAYLGSGNIKGLTKKNAADLVNNWGTDVFNILENYPNELLKIKGIGEAKLKTILESWEENRPQRHDTDKLLEYGFNEVEAVKIIKKFKKKTLQILQQFPYLISKRVSAVDYKKVDEIALENGMDKTNDIRITTAIDYFLAKMHESGDCIIDYNFFFMKVKKYLKVEDELILNEINALIEKDFLKFYTIEGVNYIQHLKVHATEKEIARRLANLVGERNSYPIVDLTRDGEKKIELSDEQKEAVENCVNEKVSILTGGAGTGKTTTINEIIKQLEHQGKSILLAAPTGKAAQRMKESTGCAAATIHRLLQFNPREIKFDVNESNPLQTDVIIIDESSMIDIYLMKNLLRAINNNAQVIIAGDINQLVSVGEGSVLRDLMESGLFKVSRLNKIFRQAETSKIITNAYDVNFGYFDFEHKASAEEDFFYIESDSDEKTLQMIKHITENKIKQSFGFNPKSDLQLLSTQHAGLLGTDNLNEFMQELVNHEIPNHIVGHHFDFKVGDKIIQNVNNYDKNIFNGDCGIITMINSRGILVKFDNMDEEVEYLDKEVNELTPAYCLSIHKSQGSEYPVVIIPLQSESTGIIDRSLLYTGITRGKSIVIMIGSKNTLQEGIKSEKSRQRKTYLKETLVQFFLDMK